MPKRILPDAIHNELQGPEVRWADCFTTYFLQVPPHLVCKYLHIYETLCKDIWQNYQLGIDKPNKKKKTHKVLKCVVKVIGIRRSPPQKKTLKPSQLNEFLIKLHDSFCI